MPEDNAFLGEHTTLKVIVLAVVLAAYFLFNSPDWWCLFTGVVVGGTLAQFRD